MRVIEAGRIRLPALRKAIRDNRVSFPSQVPVFVRNAPPELQCYSVQLYFLCGWSCGMIAKRYDCSRYYIWRILSEWKRHAAAVGYLQAIPPARALSDLKSALQWHSFQRSGFSCAVGAILLLKSSPSDSRSRCSNANGAGPS
jgi:hypothetical protein